MILVIPGTIVRGPSVALHPSIYTMSSRALRRAQKELEERQRQEQLGLNDENDESDEEVLPSKPKASLFAMLADAEDDEHEDSEEDAEGQVGATVPPKKEPTQTNASIKTSATVGSTNKKKNKKKKKKNRAKPADEEPGSTSSSARAIPDMDEIDRALLALNLKSRNSSDNKSDQLNPAASDDIQHLCAVLAVDSRHLQPANEMRKLFGRIALESENEPARARQRGRGQGIAGALAGHNTGNRGLASLGRRRNIFVQAKDEWPQATSGGLSMEVVEKRSDGTIEYRFVHNRNYQDVQRQFDLCVSSMDPDRMVQMLQLNRMPLITEWYMKIANNW
jgi:hypothetical protein